MDNHIVVKLNNLFESVVHKKDGVEFWFARDLQKLLGYSEWRKFLGVIDKAKEACKNSGFNVADHFVGADKMVDLGSAAKRRMEDFLLTRYACYLITRTWKTLFYSNATSNKKICCPQTISFRSRSTIHKHSSRRMQTPKRQQFSKIFKRK